MAKKRTDKKRPLGNGFIVAQPPLVSCNHGGAVMAYNGRRLCFRCLTEATSGYTPYRHDERLPTANGRLVDANGLVVA